VNPAPESIRLSAEHFAAATLYLVAGAVGLVWIAPQLASGDYLSPRVAGVTHLFTLGWLTTTIFGALYQLLPVALGAPIRWPRVAHASFWTFAPGAGLFACGIADGSTRLHDAGLTFVTTGIVLAMINIISSLRRSDARDVTRAAIALAICFLASTVGLGALLVHNLDTGFIAAARARVLTTHLHVALVGWALIMMAGVAHRLLPMFLLAHNADTRRTKFAVAAFATGLIGLAIGLNAPSSLATWLGVALLEIGVMCFARQSYAFYRARVRRRIDIGIRFVGASFGFLLLAAGLGPFVVVFGSRMPRLAIAYLTLGLLGGVVQFVVGFFYKIVPLLAWTAIYRDRMGKHGVPSVADLYSATVARMQLAVMPVSIGVIAAGVLAGSAAIVYAGAALFLAGVLLFAAQLVRVARGRHIRALP
jgi:hypothetical protein